MQEGSKKPFECVVMANSAEMLVNGTIDMDNLREAIMSEQGFNGIQYDMIEAGSYSRLLFRVPSYRSTFFENMKEMYDAGKFCDVVIVVGETRIMAHKLVLVSASSYFKAMFTGGFKENHQKCEEIVLDQICNDAQIVEIMVNFMYTGQAVINVNTAQNLLVASKALQIQELEHACCLFLFLNIDPHNCIGIEAFARECGCIKLSRIAQKYISNHFVEIIHNEEFLNLDACQLCQLLRKDDLSAPCESIVFKAVLDWVKHEPQTRSRFLDQLFRCVRFHLLPPRVLSEQMVQCRNLVGDCGQAPGEGISYLQRVFNDLISHKPCTQQPRKLPFQFSLFVLGGYHKKSLCLVEGFKKSTMTWEKCANMSTPRSGVACVTLSLLVYSIGGRNNTLASGNVDCADVECYNPFLNIWNRCASMTVPRSRAGAAIIDGLIYVAGGAYGPGFHSSAERYSPYENKWEKIAPMNMARMGHGCAAVNRLLYAIGGYDSQTRLSQVECYNPDDNTWKLVAPMNVPRSGAGVCAIDTYIYVIGGYSNNTQLNTCERYDTLTNQWTYVSSMSSPRSALACVAWDGKIMAIGGFNGNEFLTSVEEYDPCTDSWSSGVSMTSERSGHGAAVTVECKID